MEHSSCVFTQPRPFSGVSPISPVRRARFQNACSIGSRCEIALQPENMRGGQTNHGIAWPTWQEYAQEDAGVAPTLDNLKNLTEQQAEVIYLKRYWQPKGFCGFKDERIALMVYDWSITSGGAALQIQKLLNQKYHSNIVEDGGMGKQTVDAINAPPDQEALLQDIASIRRQYYTNLTIKDPGQIGNLKGWLNRVNDCLQVQV